MADEACDEFVPQLFRKKYCQTCFQLESAHGKKLGKCSLSHGPPSAPGQCKEHQPASRHPGTLCAGGGDEDGGERATAEKKAAAEKVVDPLSGPHGKE